MWKAEETHNIEVHAGAAPQKDVTIVMENGRIRDVGPTAKIPTPAGATVLDVTGKFIVPGIINAHGHVGAKTEPQLRQYALYGVTTATSMQTDPDEVSRCGKRRNAVSCAAQGSPP
jgi:imidazolonepropionase-like amidohydrolase